MQLFLISKLYCMCECVRVCACVSVGVCACVSVSEKVKKGGVLGQVL